MEPRRKLAIDTDAPAMVRIWQRARINGAEYREPIAATRWSWPRSTWLSRRLAALREEITDDKRKD